MCIRAAVWALSLLVWTVQGEDRLTGRVTSNNRAVPGATVTVKWAGGQAATTSDDDGQFALDGVPAAELGVAVTSFGFEPYQRAVAVAERGKPVEVTLRVAGLQQRMPSVADGSALAGLETQAAAVAEAQQADPNLASEAYLVQGSLSRGLEQPAGGRTTREMETGLMTAEAEVPSVATGTAAAPSGAADKGQKKLLAQGKKVQKDAKKAQRAPVRQVAQSLGNRRNRGRSPIQGGAFMSLRNSALDAAPYSIAGSNLQKPSYANSRFGGSLGGALRIPKLYEREGTFFFLNYTGTRSRNPYSQFAILPTTAEREGDFSGSQRGRLLAIFDPTTGQPFPGKRVPASRFDPASTGLATLIPLPNLTGAVQNYQLVTSYPQNADNFSGRMMQSLTRKDRLSVGVNWTRRDGEAVQLFGYRDTSGGSGLNLELGWTRNITPRLISNARFRYNRNNTNALPYFAYGEDISGNLGIQGNSRSPINYGPPNLNYTNFGDLTDGSYNSRRNHTWSYSEGVTYVKGRHTLTSGFEYQRLQWNSLAEQNARGTLFFGGLVTSGFNDQGLALRGTGFDYADFLLGRPQQSTVRFDGADTYMRGSQYSTYFQDEWRLRSTLTVNLGMRYEYFSPFQEKYGRMANLDLAPDLTKVDVVTPGEKGAYSGVFPAGLIDGDWNNFAPRGGISWRPFAGKRHVVRAGYGIYYDGAVYNRIPSRLASQPPFAQASTFQISVENRLTMQQPFTGPASVNIKNTYAVDRHYLAPYAQSWNLSFQYDLTGGMFVELGYLGTKGTRLVLQRQPNRAVPGSSANAEDRRPIDDAVGFTYDSTEGNSVFHAGQVRWVKRMRQGVSVNALYTFSKSIDNASSIGGGGTVVVQNDRDYAAERGLSSFDQRHALAVDAVLTSPFGPRGRLMQERNAWSTVLQDWNLMVGTNLRSGQPFTARVSGNAADSAGTGSTGSSRAEATGLPVAGGTGYFNTLAFRVPGGGTYGNAARNTIPGLTFFTMSFSFGRSFPIGDNSRRRIEVRAESDNGLNHVNITGLNTVVNAAEYGLATRAGQMRTYNLTVRYRF